MAFEKRYTAKQAAEAVLKVAQGVLAKSELLKAENSGKENAKPSEHDSKDADQKAQGKAPTGEMKPAQKEAAPSDEIQSQKAPEANPAEAKEGNNELAGTTPTQVGQDGKNVPGGDEIKGHLKLAKFIGYMEARRKARSKVSVV